MIVLYCIVQNDHNSVMFITGKLVLPLANLYCSAGPNSFLLALQYSLYTLEEEIYCNLASCSMNYQYTYIKLSYIDLNLV